MKPNYLFKTRRQAIARARRKYSIKDFVGAIAEWDELLERNQEDALAWLGRFDCLLKLEMKEEMLEIGDRVCELWPQSEAAHNNYACLLLETRQYEKACNHFDTALAIAPERNMYYFNAGLAYKGAGKLNEAAICFEHVLEFEPEHQRALEFLSQIYVEFGIADKLIDLSLRLRMLRPGYTYPLQRRLYAMVNNPDIPEQEIGREVSLMRSVLINRPATSINGGPLTIGWIVCPFSLRFLRYVLPLMRQYRNESEIRLVAYCNNPMITPAEVDGLFDNVYRVDESTPAAFSALLKQHPTDVIIDSAGQVPNNLLAVYAARLANLQITWPFYQSKTELVLMDQAFVDEQIHPVLKPATRQEANMVSLVERLTHLPNGQYFYQGDENVTLTELPAKSNGFVTFGVVADPIQINQQSVDAWSAILKKITGSKLLFCHRHLPSELIEKRMMRLFEAANIKTNRILFESRSSNFDQRYEGFSAIDIMLSPFPMSDDMALADAMWMGVPAIAMVDRLVGQCRAGSILAAAEMQDNLCDSVEAYVERAIVLGNNTDELATIRKQLRESVSRTQLTQVEDSVEIFLQKILQLASHLH